MTVIRDVDENTANAILYGFNSETTEYFKNKYNMFKESIVTNNPLANTHAGFFNNLNYINSDTYITNIKDKLHSLSVAGNDDENIYYYNNPVDANRITMEYIMANSKISNLYDRGLVNGYADKYVHNSVEAENRYASVMNNSLHDGDRFITYYGYDLVTLSDGDKELIKQNWKRCLNLLKQDIDPTS